MYRSHYSLLSDAMDMSRSAAVGAPLPGSDGGLETYGPRYSSDRAAMVDEQYARYMDSVLTGKPNVSSALGSNSEASSILESNREAQEQAALDQWRRDQESAQKAMDFEADQARINREWQEEMSNTAYQRAVADLKEAGLNPILAYTQGAASTPSGSKASGFKASVSKADVDVDTVVEVLKAYLSYESDVRSSIIGADALTSAATIGLIGDLVGSLSRFPSKKK